MALFVDGPASTIEDLTDQDSALLEVVQTNGVNLTTKLRLATREIGIDLDLTLLLLTPVLNADQVVVNRALRQWEGMHTLALVYRDVAFTQVVDRYEAKWQAYAKLASDARDNFLVGGLPIATDPIHQAAAPLLTTTPGPQTGGAFYASVAWVNLAGQEGAASVASSITVTDGNVMVVAAVLPPANAVGFRVYAGPILSALVLQNPVAIASGSTFQYVPGQVTAGVGPGHGQKPDLIRPVARALLRG
jgi:hypothetical protein